MLSGLSMFEWEILLVLVCSDQELGLRPKPLRLRLRALGDDGASAEESLASGLSLRRRLSASSGEELPLLGVLSTVCFLSLLLE